MLDELVISRGIIDACLKKFGGALSLDINPWGLVADPGGTGFADCAAAVKMIHEQAQWNLNSSSC